MSYQWRINDQQQIEIREYTHDSQWAVLTESKIEQLAGSHAKSLLKDLVRELPRDGYCCYITSSS